MKNQGCRDIHMRHIAQLHAVTPTMRREEGSSGGKSI